jgi:hypothetical protein
MCEQDIEEIIIDPNLSNELKYSEEAFDSISLEVRAAGDEEFPLTEATINSIKSFLQRVEGYKLDDFSGGSCKQGTRRESWCKVRGPVTISGKWVINRNQGYSYSIVEIKDGAYTADSYYQKASLCIAQDKVWGTPGGSWSVKVKKGLRVRDEKGYKVKKAHDDARGRHAEIAAGDMVRKIVAHIYENL